MSSQNVQAIPQHVARAKLLSKIERRLDAADRQILETLVPQWDKEEEQALISRKAPPMVKLSRAQSAHRPTLLDKLGADDVVNAEVAHKFQYQGPPAIELDKDDSRQWRLPDTSIVKDYLSGAYGRRKQFKLGSILRNFPGRPQKQSAINAYNDVKNFKAETNPYADIEPSFSETAHRLKVLRTRKGVKGPLQTDPFKQMPYVDQDEAVSISKRARRLRIRISQLGMLEKVDQVEQQKEVARATMLKNKKALLASAGGDAAKDTAAIIAMATQMFKQTNAWKRGNSQPTNAKAVAAEREEQKAKKKQNGDTEKEKEIHLAPTPRRGHTMVLIDSFCAIMFGGQSQVAKNSHKYSSQTFRLVFHPLHWEQLDVTGTKPTARAFHTAFLADETKLVVFGGIAGLGSMNDCYELDLKQWQWSVLFQYGPDRPPPRHGHTMTETSQAGRTVLFGGAGAGFFNDLFLFDSRTGRWTKVHPNGTLPAPRAFHSACPLANQTKVIIFGGQNGSANLNDLHEFDVETQTWTFVRTQGIQPSPRWGHIAINHGMDGLLIFGGAGESFHGDMLIYNAFHATWKQVHGLGNGPCGRWGHSCVIMNESQLLFFFGGCGKGVGTLGDTYSFSLEDMLPGPGPGEQRIGESRQNELDEEHMANGVARELQQAVGDEKPGWSVHRKGNEWRWSAHRKRHPIQQTMLLANLKPPTKQEIREQEKSHLPYI